MVQKDLAVLVIDDEKLILAVVGSFLRNTRFLPIMAGDLAEAKRICAESERSIDIVLSDVGLPMSGRNEFWSVLRERFPYARVVHMSGYPEDQVDVPEWQGPWFFLPKPFSVAELTNVLERASQVTRRAGGA